MPYSEIAEIFFFRKRDTEKLFRPFFHSGEFAFWLPSSELYDHSYGNFDTRSLIAVRVYGTSGNIRGAAAFLCARAGSVVDAAEEILREPLPTMTWLGETSVRDTFFSLPSPFAEGFEDWDFSNFEEVHWAPSIPQIERIFLSETTPRLPQNRKRLSGISFA